MNGEEFDALMVELDPKTRAKVMDALGANPEEVQPKKHLIRRTLKLGIGYLAWLTYWFGFAMMTSSRKVIDWAISQKSH